MSMNALGEIQTIIATSGFSRAKLAAMLREIMPKEAEKSLRKKSEPAQPVTKFTTVVKHYTCLHCNKQFSATVQLTKGEDTAVVTKEGKVMVINSSSPAEVDCVTSSCSWCSDYIKSLSREELETNYMHLLSLVSLVRRAENFGKKITIGREVKL